MLLDMRSGIGDFFGPRYEDDAQERAARARGLPAAVCRQRRSCSSRARGPVFKRRVRRAWPHHPEGVGDELLRLRADSTSSPWPECRTRGSTRRALPCRTGRTVTRQGSGPRGASTPAPCRNEPLAGGVTSTLHDLLNYAKRRYRGSVGTDTMRAVGRSVNGLASRRPPGLRPRRHRRERLHDHRRSRIDDPPAAERLARDLRQVGWNRSGGDSAQTCYTVAAHDNGGSHEADTLD